MDRILHVASLSILACSLPLIAQANRAQQAPPIPADRAADSFRIYSSLIPLGETAGPDWPHGLWLISDTTVEMAAAGQSCHSNGVSVMDPHASVHPPEDRRNDFAEILLDFDRHCHDRYDLRNGAWAIKGTVRLLTAVQQQEFEQSRIQRDAAAAKKYAGACALYSFGPVFFNARHTVALVYATHWCGSLCGQGFWIALERKNGEWRQLGWRADSWIS